MASRRHHHGPDENPLAVRHIPQFLLRVQGQSRRDRAGRPSLGRSLHPQWQRAPERLPRPRLGPTHRGGDRRLHLG